MRRLLLPLAVVALSGLAAKPVRAQAPFDVWHDELSRALDSHLDWARRDALLSTGASPQPVASPESGATSVSQAFVAQIAPSRIAAARRRLLARGVDAARIFAEEGVPSSLIVLAGVESNYDPLALSPKGARGLWQLMPETARRFGLRVEGQADDRIHPVHSTRAAAHYLRDLYLRFGDWTLALAAYNLGESRVTAAVEAARTRDFSRISDLGLFPVETRRYVPAVLGHRVELE